MTILHAPGHGSAEKLVTRHEHAWEVESSHSTSEGRVLYVRCGQCGTQRIDAQGQLHLPPAALSKELPAGYEPDGRTSMYSGVRIRRKG